MCDNARSSTRHFLLAPLIDCLDSLDEKHQEVIHRARAAVAPTHDALATDATVNAVEIRLDAGALHLVNGLQIRRQVHFDAAALAQGGTGRTARRFFNAAPAN